jgi:hypothetical protein
MFTVFAIQLISLSNFYEDFSTAFRHVFLESQPVMIFASVYAQIVLLMVSRTW